MTFNLRVRIPSKWVTWATIAMYVAAIAVFTVAMGMEFLRTGGIELETQVRGVLMVVAGFYLAGVVDKDRA